MRIIDENGNTITEYDLTKGELRRATIIRPEASPIDNETKHAWADEDYEDVLIYHVWNEQELAEMAEAARRAEQDAFLAEAPKYFEALASAFGEVE